MVTKRSSVFRRGNQKDIFKTFQIRGHFPQKNLKSKIGQTGTSLREGYRSSDTAERYCLLHVVVKWSGSFRDQSTFLYDVWLRSYGALNLPNFRILAHFPHTKPLKRPFR